jgi:hypothetical protein
MYLMRSNLNVAALKQAVGLAVADFLVRSKNSSNVVTLLRALPSVGSPISEIHSVRPEQKLQNDAEYPKHEDHAHPPDLNHKKIVSSCPSMSPCGQNIQMR